MLETKIENNFETKNDNLVRSITKRLKELKEDVYGIEIIPFFSNDYTLFSDSPSLWMQEYIENERKKLFRIVLDYKVERGHTYVPVEGSYEIFPETEPHKKQFEGFHLLSERTALSPEEKEEIEQEKKCCSSSYSSKDINRMVMTKGVIKKILTCML